MGHDPCARCLDNRAAWHCVKLILAEAALMFASRLLKVLAIALSLTACERGRVAEMPKPLEISESSVGYFCGMELTEHPGPKGQIFVADAKEPVWFSSVRETFAFTMLPEEPKNLVAIYVTDMGRARNWQQPEPGTWIDAKQAYYVINSNHESGMGGGEAVPFGEEDQAKRFVAENGGKIVRFSEMPEDFVLQGTDVGLTHLSAGGGEEEGSAQ
jgi:copper chaperone NosL